MAGRTRIRALLLGAMLALAGLGSACDLRGLSTLARDDSDGLVTVRGQIDPAALVASEPHLALRVVLVWLQSLTVPQVCLLPGFPDEYAEVCPDPFGYVVGRTAADEPLALDAEGRFALAAERLPAAEDLVGDLHGRQAQGVLVLYDDANQSAGLELGLSDFPGLPDEPGYRDDRVLAVSMRSLVEPGARLLYREGHWDAESTYYPLLGCGEPPFGFSVVKADGWSAQADCSLHDLAEPLSMLVLEQEEAQRLACTGLRANWGRGITQPVEEYDPRFRTRGPDEPGDRPDEPDPGPDPGPDPEPDPEPEPEPEELDWSCVGAEALVVFRGLNEMACPWFETFALSGCWESLFCADPQWDLRDAPPSWWPCGEVQP